MLRQLDVNTRSVKCRIMCAEGVTTTLQPSCNAPSGSQAKLAL